VSSGMVMGRIFSGRNNINFFEPGPNSARPEPGPARKMLRSRAKVGGGGGDGEEPAIASSVEVDPAAARLWAMDPAAEAQPEPGGMGRRRGKKGEVRKGGEGGRSGRRADSTTARSPPVAGGGGGRQRRWCERRTKMSRGGRREAEMLAEKTMPPFLACVRGGAGGALRISLTREAPPRSSLL
jgi:hypothetical protein